MRIRACLFLPAALLVAACSASTPNPAASGTASSSASVSPSPSATKKATRIPSARMAVYEYRGSIWLYDVPTNKARQLTQGGAARLPKWMSNDRISFVQGTNDGTPSTLRALDLKTSQATDLFSVPTGINTYGWSPDRQTLAYITTDNDGYPHVRFRSIGDEATQPVATLARALGRGAEPNDDARIEFSKDGRYVLIVYTPADGVDGQTVPNEQSQLQVRSLEGSLAFAGDPSREPTMGIWSPDGKTMEFRDNTGVRTWNPATDQTRLLRKLRWFDPSPSRDGRRVAFDSGWERADVRVRVFNVGTAKYDTVSGSGRAFPVFAGTNSVWAQEVRRCRGACLLPVEPGPRVFTIDIRTGKERALALQSLQDVDVLYA